MLEGNLLELYTLVLGLLEGTHTNSAVTFSCCMGRESWGHWGCIILEEREDVQEEENKWEMEEEQE